MRVPEQRIIDLVSTGKLSTSEGEELLAALRRRRTGWRLLLNPLEQLQTGAALGLALLTSVLGLVVSFLGVRFDGALDLHLVAIGPSAALAIFDIVNATFITSVTFWAVSLALGRQGRFVDFLAGVGLARTPWVLTAALLILVSPGAGELQSRVAANPLDPTILLVSLAILPGLIWFIVLLYQSFKTASGLGGKKLVWAFIGGLIAAEVLSKVLLVVVHVG